MAQDWAKPFYNSKEWLHCRDAYIKYRISVDGGLCEVCHKNLGYIVHHMTWLDSLNVRDPGTALNFANLRYECQECHNREHDDGSMAKRKAEPSLTKVLFDQNGDVIKDDFVQYDEEK